MKFIAVFISLVFAAFSYNGFIHNDLSTLNSTNKIIAMLSAVYGQLVAWLGFTATGLVFALCAIGIVWAAFFSNPKSTTD